MMNKSYEDLERLISECKPMINRLDEEIEALKAERDALAASLSKLCEFRDEVVGVMNESSGVVGWHKNHTVATWDELLPVVPDFESPQQCLRDVQTEAGRAGYYEGFKAGLLVERPALPQQNAKSAVDYFKLMIDRIAKVNADEYAATVRQGAA